MVGDGEGSGRPGPVSPLGFIVLEFCRPTLGGADLGGGMREGSSFPLTPIGSSLTLDPIGSSLTLDHTGSCLILEIIGSSLTLDPLGSSSGVSMTGMSGAGSSGGASPPANSRSRGVAVFLRALTVLPVAVVALDVLLTESEDVTTGP